MLLSQSGINAGEDDDCIVEMDGRDAKDSQHMITECAIRGFYQHYRTVMGL
jgi:salicylate 5-hydroxylase large subunit